MGRSNFPGVPRIGVTLNSQVMRHYVLAAVSV